MRKLEEFLRPKSVAYVVWKDFVSYFWLLERDRLSLSTSKNIKAYLFAKLVYKKYITHYIFLQKTKLSVWAMPKLPITIER